VKSAIAVRGLTKTYAEGSAGVKALRGVDLDVEAGELVLLMGPSGSGKTTLLSIMGCILTASSGSVHIAGREVSMLSEKELPRVRLEHIGFVFQGFNLFPTLTAAENIELMLDLKRVRGPAAKKRSRELLSQGGDRDDAWLGAPTRSRRGDRDARLAHARFCRSRRPARRRAGRAVRCRRNAFDPAQHPDAARFRAQLGIGQPSTDWSYSCARPSSS